MTNIVLISLIAAEIVLAGIVYLARRRIPRLVLGGLGAAFAAAGLFLVLLVEMEYSSANTRAAEASVSLARAGTILDTTFTTALTGRFELFLETDRGPGIAKFGCLTGDERFEPLCPKGDPELELVWTVAEQGAPVARGGSDLAGWRQRQAALDPADAAKKRSDFLADIAKTENPSDGTPLFHSLGFFEAQAGHAYRLAAVLRRPAPTLAATHPRILVGYSGEETRGLGLWVVLFCVIGVIAGGAMLLAARGKQEAA